jgi:hypothetical protein
MNNSGKPDYTYEELRNAAIDILAGRTKITFNQYNHLKNGVRENLFYEKNGTYPGHYDNLLSPTDSDIFLEVFWDFFRQGIITLGMNDQSLNFPFFRVSAHGKRILENKDVFFYHDVSSYEALLRQQVPDIDDVTMIYLKEAMQSFYSGCYLSSSVMLGVASEHIFLKLLEKIENSTTYNGSNFHKAFNERNMSKKFEIFKNKLDQEIGNKAIILDPDVRENLDSNLKGIWIRYVTSEMTLDIPVEI